MKTKSIWIKVNNPNDKPEEWIRNGCISISEIDPRGINKPYKWLENGKYSWVTQLGVGDYIYVYEVKDKFCLLTYRFELSSKYVSKLHGWHLKNVWKCQDNKNPCGEGKHNGRSLWAAPKNFKIKGSYIEFCTDHKINWERITMNKIEKVISTQELIDYDNKDKDVIADHLYREGQAIKREISIAGRSSEIRPAYLEKYGSSCKLCGKSYLKADGTSCILDIHHLKPIANVERETNIE